MSSTIVVRKITGADIHLDVDLNKTVSELKELIAASGKGKSIRVPGLSFKGHELRDNRPLTHYDITSKAVVQIGEFLRVSLRQFSSVDEVISSPTFHYREGHTCVREGEWRALQLISEV